MQKLLFIITAFFLALNVNAQNSKLSPYVRQAMMAVRTAGTACHAKGGYGSMRASVPTMTAFVRTTDTDVLRQQGCHIFAQWDGLTPSPSPEREGSICIASIPLDKLGALAAMPQIQRIEAGQSCYVTNDTTATITKVREVWQMQNLSPLTSHLSAITGNGVVVGVMDIGFDLTHPTFYSSDGQTYRIKQLWDQLDWTEGGEPVIGKTEEGNDTIYVGRQYVGQEALLALQHSADGLTQNHGTHTTGTAAGSGWNGLSTKYSGMAPDADICLVCNRAGNDEGLVPADKTYLYTTATDMLGFKYIFDYADKVGKPCVISFSEGSHDDLYQSGIYSEVLSKMIGPGHIICASAGNDGGGDGTYIHKAEGETGKGAFLTDAVSSTDVYVLKSKKPVKARLSFYKDGVKALDRDYDLTELANFPDSMMIDSVFITSTGTEQKVDTLVAYFETYPSCFDKNLYATDFFLKNTSYDVIPTALTLLGEDNDIEAFGCGSYFVANSLDPTLADFDHTHNILFPGSSKDVICVGATNDVPFRKNIYGNIIGSQDTPIGSRASFSSVGPAISGITKPDVMVSGRFIASSLNSFMPSAYRSGSLYYSSVIDTVNCNGQTYCYGVKSGTSMSTPVVAGIVALWLQACPTLTQDQIREVFAHTCYYYDSSMIYPNNEYGYGKIDAIAGLEYIQQHYTGIEEVSSSRFQVSDSNAIYTIDGRRLQSLDGQHGVFIVGGKKVVR